MGDICNCFWGGQWREAAIWKVHFAKIKMTAVIVHSGVSSKQSNIYVMKGHIWPQSQLFCFLSSLKSFEFYYKGIAFAVPF